MGSLLGLCRAQETGLTECQARLADERAARAGDAGACERRCRAGAAHADGRARFAFLLDLWKEAPAAWPMRVALLHPADVVPGAGGPCGAPGAPAAPGDCFRARVLQTDLRLSEKALNLADPASVLASSFAMLSLDPTATGVRIGVLGVKELQEKSPATRFLVPGDGAPQLATTPYAWCLGQDAAHFAPKNRVQWFQFCTDADPAKASMLTVAADTGALRLVPLAAPVSSLPVSG